ncbi:MAG: TonB-dependent receptor [Flavobacteriales bacterium]|nr:TonB-dependent receptor [Flavobacteriales bacterium]
MQRARSQVTLFILLTLGLLISNYSSAQISVEGIVTDTKGNALAGANVFVEGTYDGASSDIEGGFSFQTEPQDSARITIEYLGFESASRAVVLKNDQLDLEFKLKEKFNQLKAVTITAGAFEASDSKKAVALKPLDIVTTAGATGDIAGALQTLPGTTTVGESGRLFVRGGSADETQTYVDGMLVQEPYTRSAPNTAVRGRFNPFIFSGTTFTTGGYSAEYGQALSSVLLLDTKGLEEEDEWNLSLMTVGADVAGTKVWDRGSATATLSYIDLTPYMEIVPQNLDYHRLPSVLNASLSLRQKTGETGMVKVYGTQGNSRYGIYSKNPGEDHRSLISGGDDNTYLNATWRDIIATNWSLRTGVAYSHNESFTKVDDFDLVAKNSGEHIKSVATHTLNDKVSLKIGVDYFHRYRKESFGEVESYEFKYDRVGAFTEADVFITSDLALRAGVRGEYSPDSDQIKKSSSIAPRLMAAYRLGDNSQVSAAYGVFYQDTHPRTMLFSNRVGQERSEHLILNYQYMVARRTFRIEAYQKRYNDLVKYQLIEGQDHIYSNDGKGLARGVDIWWRDRKSIKNGDYWISYSYLDTERDYQDFPNSAVPSFAAEHSFSIVYKHWIQDWRSQVGCTFLHTSPRPYNDPNMAEFQSAEMDAVDQLNLNWAYLYRENVIFYAGVTNVLGQKQQYGYRFAETPDQDGIFAREAILPAADRFFFIGCFITFSKKDVNQLDKIN